MEQSYPGQVYCPICTHTVEGEVRLVGPNWKRVPKVVPGQKCARCSSALDAGIVLRIVQAA